jgi:hypothetical protein
MTRCAAFQISYQSCSFLLLLLLLLAGVTQSFQSMGALQDWKRFSLHCIGIKICGRLWIKFLAIPAGAGSLPKILWSN